jgi:hypothetical protein
MPGNLIVAIEYALIAGCVGFAYWQGGRADRLGAIWFGANMILSGIVTVAGFRSTVVQLVMDGTYALGLLPLAMIYVSYSMGLLTLLSAALFCLEALYLLNDWPVDRTYIDTNNILWFIAPLIFLGCGLVNLRRNRRAARAARATMVAA